MQLGSPREGRWVSCCRVAACCRRFARCGGQALWVVVGQDLTGRVTEVYILYPHLGAPDHVPESFCDRQEEWEFQNKKGDTCLMTAWPAKVAEKGRADPPDCGQPGSLAGLSDPLTSVPPPPAPQPPHIPPSTPQTG